MGHFVKLAGVVAVIDDLARHDQLVLVVDRDLDVVAGDRLASLRQQPCILIGPRQLRLPALLKPRQVGFHLRALVHQRRNFLRNVFAVAPTAIPIRGGTLRFRGVVRFKRGAISLDIPVKGHKPFG